MEKKIAAVQEYLDTIFGKRAIHMPDGYEEILNSKCSCAWGNNDPMTIKDCHVVWYTVSPNSVTGKGFLLFDIKPIDKPKKMSYLESYQLNK